MPPREPIGDDDCANPILVGFLREWWETARERNTKGITTYKHAYESMKACPIPFEHPKQAKVLKGLGDTLCDRLTESLADYCANNGIPMPKYKALNGDRRKSLAGGEPVMKKRKTAPRPYIPKVRSGPYALIIALKDADDNGEVLTKQQLINAAQPHCDASFDAPAEPGSYYTAWGSMKTLLEKQLVYTQGNPKRYQLTDEGLLVAKGIVDVVGEKDRPITQGPDESDLDEPVPSQARNSTRRKQTATEGTRGGNGNGISSTGNATTRSIPHTSIMSLSQALESEPDSGSDEDIASRSESVRVQRARLQALYSGAPRDYGQRRALLEHIPVQSNRTNAPTRSISAPTGNQSVVVQPPQRAITLPSLEPPTSNRVPPEPTFTTFKPSFLKAGTFTIELLLDNREVRSKTDREYLQNTLTDKGVTPLVRALKLGDALWIAREKGGKEREVVLDYIVERKRLDDLVGSIKDGRYHEQKFRLAKSGIKNVIYIVEDMTMRDVDPAMQESMDTAISSTQVVNGFFVKRTTKLDDTIRYLVRMTKLLENIYQKKDLYITPDELVDSRTYSALISHLEKTYPEFPFHLSYETFSTLVSKSASMTLRDTFLKMLMCTRGISLEKALEIQKSFETPYMLVAAYQQCKSDKEKCDLVMLKNSTAAQRRKIGSAASAKIAEVWSDIGY